MKLEFVENLSVKGKIFSLIGVIFLLIGVFTIFQEKEINSMVENDDVSNIDISMLEARRSEKDFFERKDLIYIDKVDLALANLDSLIEPYKDEEIAGSIVKYVEAYKEAFHKIVYLMKERGLDENSGAEGKLRISIHELESQIVETENKTLLADLLTLRRHEKDFFLRKNEKHITQFNNSITEFYSNIGSSPYTEAVKLKMKSRVDYYQKNFLIAAKAVNDISANIEILREDVRKIEPLITSMMYDREAAAETASKMKLIVLLISLTLGILYAYYISKTISNSLKQLTNVANKVSEGDYSVEANIQSKDEFGTLAKAFDLMIEKISVQIGYLETIPTPIMIIDKEFNIEYMNPAGAKVVGSEQKSLIGKKCYNQFKTDHCGTEKCALAQAMKNDKIVTEETKAHPNGSDLSIMYTGAPVKDKNSKIIGALEYVADVSEMKNRENYLAKSTQVILAEMEKFSSGDLTAQVKSEKEDDDIAKLFNGFNLTVTNIKNMIYQVSEAVAATASASTQISSSAEEMAAGAQEQSAQTAEVAAAMEEMSRTVVETASNATSAAEASREASEKANEGNAKLAASQKGMENIVNSTADVGKKITSLATKTEQIGAIAQVIDDIADQTNLLALNAAIEAARAGEHGRGFAVVADEVRKLAENTTKATKEIAETIKAIQLEAKDANNSTKEAQEAVSNGLRLNTEVGEVLSQILESIENVTMQINQVAAASEEQSATAEQVSTNIESINNVANESAVGVQQIASASEDLNRLTENLSKIVEQFKLDSTKNNYLDKGKGLLIGRNK
ncbi:MAG: HAMP domain-containing protein [Bacteroidetes bacterium]|nr:HAMP domain-containing protein [Nanoarchaeota archaeon]MBU1116844.1 HAMP domain-containing protein [Bacteroidota bacterium]MBU1798047.1 HAMP domain-containing protein [Bacteroidota bacterium]